MTFQRPRTGATATGLARSLRRRLESQGYRVVRFTTREVDADVFDCIEKVKALLLDGGGLGGGEDWALQRGCEWAPMPNGAPTGKACIHHHPRPFLHRGGGGG